MGHYECKVCQQRYDMCECSPLPEGLKPREDRLNWDTSHMLMAMLTAQRSPDPNTQVGAIIVDKENRMIGSGYNAFPKGIPQDSFSWDRTADDPYNTKYPYVVHAEENAILNTTEDLEGSTLYVTLFPCNECTKTIIQKGIKKIYYLDDPYRDTWQIETSKRMLYKAKIQTHHLQIQAKEIMVLDKIKDIWANTFYIKASEARSNNG